MKRLLFVLAALAAVRCFGVAASQAWVTNYVAQAIAGSKSELEAQVSVTNVGGVTTLSTGTGRNLVRIVLENATDAALQATNCSAFAMTRGITNGFLFVWDGRGRYISWRGDIVCTPTNFTHFGVQSFPTNGVDRFPGWFDVGGVLIQPSASFSLTNGIPEVDQ